MLVSNFLISSRPLFPSRCCRMLIGFILSTPPTLAYLAPCGLRGCKNRPAPFPGRMSYKATKPGSVCPVSVSLDFLSVSVVLLSRDPFCVVLFCVICIGLLCLLVVFVRLSVPVHVIDYIYAYIHIRLLKS